MPSEQPRERTRERYIDQWPKPMFLCTHCDEQTDSDPCQECASVFDERGENYPPVLRFQVVPAPAQPEQPRGEEARADKFGLHPQRQRAHKFPLIPIPDPPNAVPGKQWYACERCGAAFSEASPTMTSDARPCEPAPEGEGEES